MSDPHTFTIPNHASTPEPIPSDAEPTPIEMVPRLAASAEQLAPKERHQFIQEIAVLGDWVAYERAQKLQQKHQTDSGFMSLWHKLGGKSDTERSLMSKEAHLSPKLFRDGRSMLFFFDKIGAGHGEWVLQIASRNPDEEPTTVYYEVFSNDSQVWAKWPDVPHRLATDEEIRRLHQATSRYLELIQRELYVENSQQDR